MHAFRHWGVVMATMLVAGCATRDGVTENIRPALSSLPVPVVPSIITDPSARAEYSTMHFWQQLADTDSVDMEILEQDVANYAAMASFASPSAQREGWSILWQKRTAYKDTILPVIEDYLFNPESPVYDPDLFATAVDAADSLGILNEGDRALMVRETIRENEPGSSVSDFSFTDRNGINRNLIGAGKRQLLLFYDPDCRHCAAEMEIIQQSEVIRNLIDSGTLQVTAIYPGGDMEVWMCHAETLPVNWTVGMNARQPVGTLDGWIIRTTPELYLISETGIVEWRGTSSDRLLIRLYVAPQRSMDAGGKE